MKVITKCVIDIATGKTIYEESYQYDGAVAWSKGKKKKASETVALKTQKALSQAAQANIQLQQDIFKQIQPFAQALMSLGIDPATFMASPLGTALLAQMRAPISQEFDIARQRAFETFGAAGFSPQEGVATGPLANLFQSEALAQAGLMQQLPLLGLQLGQTGAGLLTGQQSIFDPARFAGAAAGQGSLITPSMAGQLAPAAIGAAGQALGGLFMPRPLPTQPGG